ncbi:Serine/threonine-protein kinase, partial [Coemansia sp. RSA 2052]
QYGGFANHPSNTGPQASSMAYDPANYQQYGGSLRGNPYSNSNSNAMLIDSANNNNNTAITTTNSSASSVRPSSASSSLAAMADHASAMPQALAPNGLPSANSAQGSSVKRSGILVIRVMEARNLVYPPGSQQLMARYAPYKNEAHQRPYAVVEFDKNEAVVTSLGGDMQNPLWKYRVSL